MIEITHDGQPLNSKLARNPSWTRDELILALDLYFRVPPSAVTEKHPEIIELSGLLQSLSANVDPPDGKRFRNPNSVHMKMFNFKSLDPSQDGKGLSNGGRLDHEIWDEYGNDQEKLRGVAAAIKASVSSGDELGKALRLTTQDFGLEDAAEGTILSRLHFYRERNAALVTRKKETVLAECGFLKCEVCSFDFKAAYGDLGSGFIECHHTKPVSLLRPGDRTKLTDLALVCANCHRMLHKRGRWLSVSALRELWESARAPA